MSIENHGGMISAGFNHHSPLEILHAESSRSKAEGTGEGNYELGLTKYLCSYFEGLFNTP
jgi:hypothetical protein